MYFLSIEQLISLFVYKFNKYEISFNEIKYFEISLYKSVSDIIILDDISYILEMTKKFSKYFMLSDDKVLILATKDELKQFLKFPIEIENKFKNLNLY